MLDPKLIQLIDYYLTLALKRRWIIILPFCLAMMVGIYLSFTLPKVYQAETLILVEPQRVPSDFVRSLVSIDISARLSTISQQILSRSNLEKIIKEFRLFEEAHFKNVFLEDKIEILRKQIAVKITQAKGGADAFSIAFKGNDPQKVQKIANALATYFIDENLKVREAQAIGTSSFLEDELESMRKRLTGVETSLSDFRKQYMGELPDQLQTNLRIMESLQLKLTDKEQVLRAARGSMIALQNQLSQFGDLHSQPMIRHDDPMAGESAESTDVQKLKQHLSLMQSKYKESHPDVVRLKRMIADAENQARQEAQGNADEAQGRDEDKQGLSQDPRKMQLDQVKKEIVQQEQEVKEIRDQIAMYQKRMENTPKREQELQALQRDYHNIQTAYSSLLNRKLESEIAVNMERKQKGEQFRIIDFARLPEKPIEPNMQLLFMMTVAAGLGLGAGLVFLSDLTNPSFRLLTEIEALGVPVLAAIPTFVRPGVRSGKLNHWIVSVIAISMTAVLLTGFAAVTFKGTDRIKAIVQKLR